MKNGMKVIGLAVCLAASTVTTGLLTGCAGDKYNESTGEYIDDSAITSRVKKALGNDGTYKYDDVNVSTFKGTVQLSGFVNASGQKSRAGDVAKGVEGVKEVINNITVKE